MTARKATAPAAQETPAAEPVVEETPAPVADTADAGEAPAIEDDVDDPEVEAVVLDDGNKPQVDPRADALAKLIAGESGEASGGEVATDATPLADTTGVVHEWGGDRSYLVLIEAYSAIVGEPYRIADGSIVPALHVTATKGDIVLLDEVTAKRGLSLDAIVPLD